MTIVIEEEDEEVKENFQGPIAKSPKLDKSPKMDSVAKKPDYWYYLQVVETAIPRWLVLET